MTEENKEARLAYKLWNKISQLESMLWANYEKEFFEFYREEEECNFVETNIINDDDVYPF